MAKLFMFAAINSGNRKMNHSAKNITSGVPHPMGCNDSMMSFMSMIMR
jgi:hypothetical protein